MYRCTSHHRIRGEYSHPYFHRFDDQAKKRRRKRFLPGASSDMNTFWKVKALITTTCLCLWQVVLVMHGIGALAQQYPPQDDVAASDMYPSPLKPNIDISTSLQPQQSDSVGAIQEPGTCNCNNGPFIFAKPSRRDRIIHINRGKSKVWQKMPEKEEKA